MLWNYGLMNFSKLNLLLCCALLLLQACASTDNQFKGPVPVEDLAAEQTEAESAEGSVGRIQKSVLHEQKLIDKEENTQPIVIALVEESKEKMERGELTSAAASLERALRLEPKSARLWSRLGLLRLRQKKWQQAITVAKKSNLLIVKDFDLRVANWEIITQAHSRAGNKSAAKIAAERASDLKKK